MENFYTCVHKVIVDLTKKNKDLSKSLTKLSENNLTKTPWRNLHNGFRKSFGKSQNEDRTKDTKKVCPKVSGRVWPNALGESVQAFQEKSDQGS